METVFLLLYLVIRFFPSPPMENSSPILPYKTIPQQEQTKKRDAFQVLKTKCNVCHLKRNPRKTFSIQNMDEFAPQIYKQVFIKKRMPKGNKIKLSEIDRTKLTQWLETLNLK